MNRTELIKLLIKFRMSQVGVAQGLSRDDALAMAEETVRQRVTNIVQAMSTPEGAIAAMVEAYLVKVGPLVGGVFDVENPPDTPEFKNASREAIREIEAHRNKLHRGEGTLSDRFSDYVYYRTRLEVGKEFGVTPQKMGLDSQTVTDMVKISIASLGPMYAHRQAQKSGCFVATVCFGFAEDPTVLALRTFRDETLLKAPAGRQLVRWYYKTGPSVAYWISSKPRAQALARILLRWLARLL